MNRREREVLETESVEMIFKSYTPHSETPYFCEWMKCFALTPGDEELLSRVNLTITSDENEKKINFVVKTFN